MYFLYIQFTKSKSGKIYQYLARNPMHIPVENWFTDWKALLSTNDKISEVKILNIQQTDIMDEIVTKYVDITPNHLLVAKDIPLHFILKLKQSNKIKKY